MPRALKPLAAFLLLLILPGVARTSTAPTTPTFVLAWGSNGTGPAQFSNPAGVATDALGNVYVADQNNNRVQKFDRLETFVTQWGSSGSANGQFSYPAGVAIDAAGNVLVVDEANSRIQKFSSTGTYLGQ